MLIQIERAGPKPRSQPSPQPFHFFRTEFGSHVLLVNQSRIFTIDDEIAGALAATGSLAGFGLDAPEAIGDAPPAEPPVRSLSLAVAQKCNLACSYCYAQQGDFGETPKDMTVEVADRAVDLLFAGAGSGDHVQLTFLGGEPLTNRPLIRRATERAVSLSEKCGTTVAFSITTNGTLITPSDGEFFERHGFAVTISLDGLGPEHDALRPTRGGEPTFARIEARVRPLLRLQRRMQVSARVTVTPLNPGLPSILDTFLEMGFHSVGFSPLLASPGGSHEMSGKDLQRMLAEMVDCGKQFEQRVLAGERYAFLNMMNAMREFHQGSHRPYPCGAGAGYFGVSAEGDLYACHRFVEDPRGQMGTVASGPDRSLQSQWLTARHVHRQEPCRSCWARYLCGGGCHHEVIQRGRPSCDYIRGWLDYCLRSYIRLRRGRPQYFNS